MAIKESTLPEFEHQLASTHLLLEPVPADNAVRRPHPKSMTLGELASRLADIPIWVRPALRADSFDPAPLAGEPYRTPGFSSRAAAVQRFERNVARARDAISGTDDAHFMAPWSLKRRQKDVPLPGGEVEV